MIRESIVLLAIGKAGDARIAHRASDRRQQSLACKVVKVSLIDGEQGEPMAKRRFVQHKPEAFFLGWRRFILQVVLYELIVRRIWLTVTILSHRIPISIPRSMRTWGIPKTAEVVIVSTSTSWRKNQCRTGTDGGRERSPGRQNPAEPAVCCGQHGRS